MSRRSTISHNSIRYDPSRKELHMTHQLQWQKLLDLEYGYSDMLEDFE